MSINYSQYLKNRNICCSPGPQGVKGERGPQGCYGGESISFIYMSNFDGGKWVLINKEM